MRLKQTDGFTLIEIVIVIIVLGLLAGIAFRQLGGQIETAQYEQTKKELDQLALAITGNPRLITDGSRTDFGYVGDIGALPPSLTALVTNPGGYATWDGPYIDPGPSGYEYLTDAWSVAYVLSDSVIKSVGSGSEIDKRFSPGSASLFGNRVDGYVVDAGDQPPGSSYADSVMVELIYPNGSGGLTVATTGVTRAGIFSFNSVPIGNHKLRLIHLPTADTIQYQISIEPGSHLKLRLTHPADIW